MTAITTGDGAVLRIAAPQTDLRDAVADTEVTVAEVGSTGHPGLEPLVLATLDGRTAVYPDCSADEARAVAEALAGGDPGGAGGTVVEHDTGTATRPELPGDVGRRRVTGGCGWRRPADPDDHAAAGGFVDADAVEAVAEGIAGRGWGDWCHDARLTESWDTARAADGQPTVVVNAHGSAADRLLVESAPFEPLEGAQATARAVDADRVVVYVSAADRRALDHAAAATANYPDPAVPFEVREGPEEYIAAEPTMAIEAIEGNDRLEARVRPPGPDEVGIHGGPTLVHTARTFAHLAVGLREDDPADTRLVTVIGDVDSAATVELPESGSLETAIEAVDVNGRVKAACVGGQFGGLTDSLDIAPDPDSLREADLGTEGLVEVLAGDRCVVEFVGQRTQLAADTNCGRCVPCREGTTQLAELLRDVYDGEYRDADVAELAGVMERSSICAFGVQAGRPARTAIDAFDAEFAAHADGRCPDGDCMDAIEVNA